MKKAFSNNFLNSHTCFVCFLPGRRLCLRRNEKLWPPPLFVRGQRRGTAGPRKDLGEQVPTNVIQTSCFGKGLFVQGRLDDSIGLFKGEGRK